MDRKQFHIGPFPAFLSLDYREGRFQPEAFARFAAIDPATAQRYLRGTLPLPAELIAPLVEFTRNSAYIDVILSRLGLLAVPAPEEEPEGSSGPSGPVDFDFDALKEEAAELIADVALFRRALVSWIEGPAKDGGANRAAACGQFLKILRRSALIGRNLGERESLIRAIAGQEEGGGDA